LISDISEFTPAIRQHRRLSDSDLAHLNSGQSELIMDIKRNRLLVTLPSSVTIRPISFWMEQYEKWLDDNISGFYTIESSSTSAFVLSFEIEADMIQFVLAFK